MLRILSAAFILFSSTVLGQVRMTKLILHPRETYELKGSDILVVDTLILHDSSRLILNQLKEVNFIHAKAAVFYPGTVIMGKGVHGIRGRNGRPGVSPSTPCTDGGSGGSGGVGTDGGKGTNLFLYFSDLTLKGKLTIDVSGGDAGDGGDGGTGGNGGPGTRLCVGGRGGQGGAGVKGGNGGNAGTITFVSPRIPELRSLIGDLIIIRNYGGNHGLGGEGGAGGFAGLSPVGNNKMDGKPGRKGLKGKEGIPGKTGAINFQDK